MHFSLLAIAAAALAGIATAAPTSSHVLHEKREAPLRKWVKRSRMVDDGSTKLPMRIGMIQSNLEKGDDLLMEV